MSKYCKDDIVEGCVTGIEKYGIFVTLDEYYSGLVHISEISDNFVRDVNRIALIGEKIRVRVIDSNDENFHVKLSIKNLDYRCEKNRNNRIIETHNAFDTLKKQLDVWIEQKKNEKN